LIYQICGQNFCKTIRVNVSINGWAYICNFITSVWLQLGRIFIFMQYFYKTVERQCCKSVAIS
jgi:hypothetical protein